jgi:hypothetical protein
MKLMKFIDIFFSKENRFSVGIEQESGRYYLAIPVTTGIADYEEFYEINEQDFNKNNPDIDHLKKIAQLCRERKNDSKLILGPRNPRAIPD